LLYVIVLFFAKYSAILFLMEGVLNTVDTNKKKIWLAMLLSTLWLLATVSVLVTRCGSSKGGVAFGTECVSED
jgi:hypothetical protein